MCPRCSRPMRLHRGRSRSPSVVRINEQAEVIHIEGGRVGRGTSRNRGDRGGGVLTGHLKQALAVTDDPQMRGVLQAQLARLDATSEQTEGNQASVVESMRQADGAWRAAVNRHTQVVNNVIKLRASLATSEAKESEAALEVARTEAIKKKAAEALAKAEGVRGDAQGDGQQGPKAAFTVSWDENLFAEIAELDFEEGERAELEQVQKGLEELKQQFNTKEPQVQAFLERARAVRKAQEDRFKKKRKGEDGKATATDPEAGGTAPTPGAGSADGKGPDGGAPPQAEDSEALKAEAARLSAARFAAQEAQKNSPGSQSRAHSH